jgi:5-(carboxyamino)imidazole ribonucleotide synthase
VIVGVLGGGQLGWMLALAGEPLGIRCRFLDPDPAAPAARVGVLIPGAYDDPAALARFGAGLAVTTWEFENVPVQVARSLSEQVPVRPPPDALEVAQDRLAEKTFFQRLGIPVPPFEPVDSRANLETALSRIGCPAVLKTRRLGYDGKGQHVLETRGDADAAWARLGGVPLILEGFVPFGRELSVLAVRGADGSTASYPLVETHHRAGILRLALAPAPDVAGVLQARAEAYVRRVLDALQYVGMLAIELFQVGDGLLANEMAPRVHNSGHWSIEGAETSQFENHLRAVCGLPLGSTAPRGCSAMVNLIGTMPDLPALLAVGGAHAHLYGKAPRPGRKLGHVTITGADRQTIRDALDRLAGVDPVLGEILAAETVRVTGRRERGDSKDGRPRT